MSSFEKRRTFSVKNLTLTAVFTAILCVVSPLSIQIGAIPISVASLAVFLACSVLGAVKSAVAVTVTLPLFWGVILKRVPPNELCTRAPSTRQVIREEVFPWARIMVSSPGVILSFGVLSRR